MLPLPFTLSCFPEPVPRCKKKREAAFAPRFFTIVEGNIADIRHSVGNGNRFQVSASIESTARYP